MLDGVKSDPVGRLSWSLYSGPVDYAVDKKHKRVMNCTGTAGSGNSMSFKAAEQPFGNQGPLTIHTVLSYDTAQEGRFVSLGQSSAGDAFCWNIESAGGGNRILYRHDSGNIRYGPVLTASTEYSITLVMPIGATTTDDILCYINGAHEAGTRNAGSNQTIGFGTSNGVVIGADFASFLLPFAGQIKAQFGWSRALAAAEIKSLYRDTYQILKPVVPVHLFLASATVTAGSLLLMNRSIANYGGTRQ